MSRPSDDDAGGTRPDAAPARVGRAPVTTRAELSHVALQLFIERGFAQTTVDDVAAAAGIGRRTLFRYFPSKSDLPWGDFESLLDTMRQRLAAAPAEQSMTQALASAVIEFNALPDAELPFHRQRMELLLQEPDLIAYSALRYASWRQVIADFAAVRLGLPADSLRPQAIGWTCLGLSISSYEQWLRHPEARLQDLLVEAFDLLSRTLGTTTTTTTTTTDAPAS